MLQTLVRQFGPFVVAGAKISKPRGVEAGRRNTGGSMKRFLSVTVPRMILGAIFLLGAIDGFAFVFTGRHLVHPPTSESGLQLEAALKATGFFWPFMKLVELVGAACLLTNRAPAFGLALLSPIMAVVVLFHLFLNPQGIPLAIVLGVCGAALLYAYAPRYAYLFAGDAADVGQAGRNA